MSTMASNNFISDIFNFVGNASTKLLTLAASADSSIHTFEKGNPLVADAINLAQQELGAIPGAAQAESLGSAVLGFAQMIASLTSSAATSASANATVKQAAPAPAAT